MSSKNSPENPLVTEPKTVISPEVKYAAVGVVLGDIEVSEVLRDKREETLALVQRLLSSAGIEVTFSLPKNDQSQTISIEIPEVSQLQSQAEITEELTPEQKEVLFNNLRSDFLANMYIHPQIKWEDVQKKLENSPAATLVTLNKMWERGGEPTVTDFDIKTGKYRFDDCSRHVPQVGVNTNYVEAEQMAQEMGADLMEPEHYKNKFQKLSKSFDIHTQNWLKTSQIRLQSGEAFVGFRRNGLGCVQVKDANNHDVIRGFRTSLWV